MVEDVLCERTAMNMLDSPLSYISKYPRISVTGGCGEGMERMSIKAIMFYKTRKADGNFS
jgi:hypothetical protein